MLCSGSLSVLLGLIMGRSVVVLLKFLFLVFLFRFGFCTECVCLLVYYWRIMFVPFLLLYHWFWYPYMLSWTLLVECVRYIVLRYVPLVCIKKQLTFLVETNIQCCVSLCVIRKESEILLSSSGST